MINLDRFITSKELELVSNLLFFMNKSTKPGEFLLNSFSKFSITLILETEKDVARKESDELVSFMKLDIKVLNKLLAK